MVHLIVESTTQEEVLLTMAKTTNLASQFGCILPRNFVLILVPTIDCTKLCSICDRNSQHHVVIGIGTIELNLPTNSTYNVCHIPKLSQSFIYMAQLD